jgi:hypothetical protein
MNPRTIPTIIAMTLIQMVVQAPANMYGLMRYSKKDGQLQIISQ